MPRPKLNLSEEERREKEERQAEQRRRSALKYYHEHNPSKNPRKPLEALGMSEGMLNELKRKKDYFKNYYQMHRENILTKANLWNQTHKGLANTVLMTTIE
jgi:hypothetical protein